MSGWTEERTALALKLARDGHSGSQIAKVLGVTRNTVISKVSRMGGRLHGQDGVRGQKVEIAAPRTLKAPAVPRKLHSVNPLGANGARRTAQQAVHAVRRATEAIEPSEAEFIDSCAGLVGAVTDLLHLGAHMCKWPFGSGPFTFCGAARAGDGPYCGQHERSAHRPAKGWLSDAAVGLSERKHRRTSVPTFDDFERKAAQG